MPEDSAAIIALFNDNPDTGRIAIAAQYHRDPLHITTSLAPKTIVGAAVDTTTGQLAGIGMVRPEENLQLAGQPVPSAVLNSLIVHPAHRRHGIAKALAQWRLEAVRAELDNPLIFASIQHQNEGSMAVARSWAKAIVGPMQTCLIAISNKRPKSGAEVSIRLAEAADLEEIATNINQFYQDYAFYSPKTAQSLSRWLERSPLSGPVRRYAIAVDGRNNIVAGLGITEQHRFMQMKVMQMPLVLRMLNQLVGMVPTDGYLKQSAITHFWFSAHQQDAARLLWQTVRWLVRNDNTHLTFSYDPRGPFPEIIRLPKWMPKGAYVIALSQPLPFGNILLCPP